MPIKYYNLFNKGLTSLSGDLNLLDIVLVHDFLEAELDLFITVLIENAESVDHCY
jgi:hypothetical protein